MSFTNINSVTYASAAAAQGFITFTVPAGGIAAGSFCIMGFCADISGLTFLISDNSSQAGVANVYTQLGPVGAAAFTGNTAYILKMTRALAAGDVVTVTLSANATRACGIIRWMTPTNGNAVLDKTTSVASQTTSPVSTPSSGVLTSTVPNEFCSTHNFWKGTAVASGWAASGTAFGGNTPILSTGATTRVELNAYEGSVASTTAITSGATYTTIVAGCAIFTAFKDDPIPPGAALQSVQQAAQGFNRPFRYDQPRSRVSMAFVNSAPVPDTFAAVAQSRPVFNYRGSYSLVACAADEKIDSYTSQTINRPVPNYAPPLSRSVPSFAPAVTLSTDFAMVIQGFRPDYRYDGGRSQTIPVYDPATNTFADWGPSPVSSRVVPFYSPPRSPAPPMAWGASVITDAFIAAAISRATPFYNPSRSAFAAVFDQPSDSIDWASVAQGYRPPFRYLGGPSRAFTVWDPATSTYADWASQPTMSRPVPPYRPPASQVAQAWVTPATPAGTEWVPAIVSRSVPFYGGSYSLFAGAADEGIDSWASVAQARPSPLYRPPSSIVVGSPSIFTAVADTWAQVAQSRATQLYRAPRSFLAAPFDSPVVAVSTYSPGVTRSMARDYYQASQSFASLGWDDHACTTLFPDTMLGPDTMLFPDLCPQVELGFVVQNRVVPFYRGSASVVIPVFDPGTATFRDWTPGLIQSRPAPLYRPGRSQIVIPGSPTPTPDTYAPIAQNRARAPQRGPSSSTSIGFASPPADSYVVVATSRPSLSAVVRRSSAILPVADILVVTIPPQGGGGEWVIWGKPSFPGNAPGAWPRFPAPYFRRPSRREKRGY